MFFTAVNLKIAILQGRHSGKLIVGKVTLHKSPTELIIGILSDFTYELWFKDPKELDQVSEPRRKPQRFPPPTEVCVGTAQTAGSKVGHC